MRPTKSADKATERTLAWWRNPGVVYFVGVGAPPVAVKIGMLAVTNKQTWVSAIRRRLDAIQSSNHELAELLGVIYFRDGEYPTKAAEDRERELHQEFKYLARFREYTRGSEWFTASPELLTKIRELSISPEVAGLPRTSGIKA